MGNVRMPEHRLPKRLFYGELKHGKRAQGGQKKRFKDTLKSSLKAFNVDVDSWETLAKDRTSWRSAIKKGAANCEVNRRNATEFKRKARKDRAQNTIDPDQTIPCPNCDRTFRARIGLISHQRTHSSATAPNP